MKKFLTVLLALSVVFTYSFSSVGAVFAVSAEDAEEQALANAKESAVYALEHFVRLSDYDADGQAEVKEIIEEGTTLINLQTKVEDVATTLNKYQQKLLNVKNADANALAAAKKAAIESVKDYIALLEDTGAYNKGDFGSYAIDAEKAINGQASVVGVEFVRDAWYEVIEKVKMKDGSDAEAAKALAEAKAKAILVVKGDAEAVDGWKKIVEDTATSEQIAAYKAKVNEIVAFIKAADSMTELGKYIREKAEVEDLAAATEKDAAQAKVKEEIYNWAKDVDYATYADTYANIKSAVEKIGFGSSSDKLKFNDKEVIYNGKSVVVKDMGDVDTAVSRGIEYLKTLENTKLASAQKAAKTDLARFKTLYDVTVDELFTAERAVDAATTSAEVGEIVAKYRSAWRLSAMAEDEDYKLAVSKADTDIKAAVLELETKENVAAWQVNTAYELYETVMEEIKDETLYDHYKAHIDSNVKGVKDIIAKIGDGTYTDYNAVLTIVKDWAKVSIDNVNGSGAGFEALKAQVKADVDVAKTIKSAYKIGVEGKQKLEDYEADSTDPLIARFAAYKKAVVAVEALPGTREVTLADKDAVLAAYKAYVNDGAVRTNAYCEEYGRVAEFVGEDDALAKIEALDELVKNTLADKVTVFKNKAYTDFLTSSKYNTYTAAQQAQLDKIYADAVAAMNKAADTGYADDIDYIAEDALAAMAEVVNKYVSEEVAKLIADAKDFLKTTYNAADYNTEQLAEIDEIIATVDGAKSKRDVATLTIAARKAIAKVAEADIVDEDAAKIAAVESLKIKTTTKRYDGKKMLVKWTVSGDASQADGYRIYFSTKKTNSGYKYLAKTTKNHIYHTSIKTNKNVKKGQRVFYRVRAYVEIDGQRYFSDYSTVGNRIWK